MEKAKKVNWIESLRFISCIAVVMIHVIGEEYNVFYNTELLNFRWILDSVIFQVLIIYGVPVFLMISGYLLLNPEKDVNIQKIKKYLSRMIIVLLIFGFAFCLLENVFNNGFNNIGKTIVDSIYNLFQEKSWGHMWYIYMLIGIYILTPILRNFVKFGKDEEIKFFLVALFILGFIIPTINIIFDLQITTFYIASSISHYVFYYLMGYFIGNSKIVKDKYIYIFGIIGLIGYIVLCFLKIADINSTNLNVFICI